MTGKRSFIISRRTNGRREYLADPHGGWTADIDLARKYGSEMAAVIFAERFRGSVLIMEELE